MPGDDGEDNVGVCVRIRPLSTSELEACCRVVAHQTPGEPQLVLGDKKPFTFDKVYPTDTAQDEIFGHSVQNMIVGALEGRNQTILAYGQTGSGKTFTMGTGFDVDMPPENEGIVPRSVKYLFAEMSAAQLEAKQKGTPIPEFQVTVSFVELYCGQFYDLLAPPILDDKGVKQPSDVKIQDEKNEDGSYAMKVTNVMQTEVVYVKLS